MSNYPAGPSRSYTPPLPPPVPPKTSSPSLSPSFSSSHSVDRPAPGGGWANGNGTTEIPDAAEGSRRNPLVDLIDSEKLYVEQLGLVIRVSHNCRALFLVFARLGSIDHTPSLTRLIPILTTDHISASRGLGHARTSRLRSSTGCFAASSRSTAQTGRSERYVLSRAVVRPADLVQKLKEIGPNPSSPKALGDLLMRWVRTDLFSPVPHVSSLIAAFSRSMTSSLPIANTARPTLQASTRTRLFPATFSFPVSSQTSRPPHLRHLL
jgi:hypothetical protein